MGEGWITSWYWTWRPVDTTPPSAPQVISDARAKELVRLLDTVALHPGEDEIAAPFLALAHERLVHVDAIDDLARVEYRVSPRVRFPNSERARGAARKAIDHVRRIEALGKLAPTRGPFHLSEILAQAGLAIVTLRADVLQGESSARVGMYLPLAITRSGGPLEPMQFGLLDLASAKIVWCPDDVFSRAWHAPMAGGEILALLPTLGAPPRTRSGSFRADSPRDESGSQPAAPGRGTPSAAGRP